MCVVGSSGCFSSHVCCGFFRMLLKRCVCWVLYDSTQVMVCVVGALGDCSSYGVCCRCFRMLLLKHWEISIILLKHVCRAKAE